MDIQSDFEYTLSMPIDDKARWDFGEMTDSRGLRGLRTRFAKIRVPKSLTSVGNGIQWELPDDGRKCEADADLLYQFVRLTDASDEKISDFVMKWGPLGFCEHHVIWRHDSTCGPLQRSDSKYWEFFEDWRRLASEFKAILDLAAWIRSDPHGPFTHEENLRIVDSQKRILHWSDIPIPAVPADLPCLIRITRFAVNEYMKWAGITMRLDWDRDRPDVVLWAPGLYGRLVIQLVLAIAGAEGFETCTACGQPFIPSRAPRSRERHFCSSCKPIAKLLAKRDYNRREQIKRRISGQASSDSSRESSNEEHIQTPEHVAPVQFVNG